MSGCVECGYDLHTDGHHPNKRDFPGTVVMLCPNCHRRCHAGMLLVRNEASSRFEEWLGSEEEGGYVRWEDQQEKLLELGYLPIFDSQREIPEVESMLRRLGWDV